MQQQDIPKSAPGKTASAFFAKNLKLLRAVHGVSQQKLAEVLGLKRNNIASYEAGIVEPTAERFLAVARYFDLSPHILASSDLSLQSESSESYRLHEMEGLDKKMDTLIDKTLDLKKIIEGFETFYDLKKTQYPADNPELLSLSNDFENLLGILENLLETNLEFIHSLRK